MRYPRKWPLAVVCLLALAALPFVPARRGAAQSAGRLAVIRAIVPSARI